MRGPGTRMTREIGPLQQGALHRAFGCKYGRASGSRRCEPSSGTADARSANEALSQSMVVRMRRRRGRRSGAGGVLVLLCVLGIFAGSVRAKESGPSAAAEPNASNWAIEQSELCTNALRRAEQRYHLPASLLQSIARVESGRPISSRNGIGPWPWTIDADGSGFFFDSKLAAIAWM